MLVPFFPRKARAGREPRGEALLDSVLPFHFATVAIVIEASMASPADRFSIEEEIRRLEEEKSRIEHRIALLRSELRSAAALDHKGQRAEEAAAVVSENGKCGNGCEPLFSLLSNGGSHGLTKEMVYRYSRHLLIPAFGVEGQSNLSKSSILVVGAGGLGSPIAMYLAACGAGRLGIVDGDIVEMNNLQRQIIHTEASVGKPKVQSAAAACHAINSTMKLDVYNEPLLARNALEIVSRYDIVVDATDNVPTRYMINDCCVLLNKPLVSGAALGLEGQLTIYNHNGGPCYRCLFPAPPPSSACQRCSDSGVLGVVPGVIGCLQALEAIKLASSVGEPLSGKMLLFDALSARIRIVKIRGKSPTCDLCGENPILTHQLFKKFDYEKFTQTPIFDQANRNLQLLPDTFRISSTEYKELLDNGKPHLLVDVRPSHHFKIASMKNSVNIPLSNMEKDLSAVDTALKEARPDIEPLDSPVYVICRRGNDSQLAVELLRKKGYTMAKDIIGGFHSWAQHVDPDFPIY